eukprot:TRINITY_DN6649_c0_g5_i1.p2 TRINITY_DN6649_c0_g5~~TRINITY_DN6649_c0_g5_i1.p2  ORF type:complete len:376 (+),score=96.67 TRINITY_DN6649_c0_g5_i1:109-1236(+)
MPRTARSATSEEDREAMEVGSEAEEVEEVEESEEGSETSEEAIVSKLLRAPLEALCSKYPVFGQRVRALPSAAAQKLRSSWGPDAPQGLRKRLVELLHKGEFGTPRTPGTGESSCAARSVPEGWSADGSSVQVSGGGTGSEGPRTKRSASPDVPRPGEGDAESVALSEGGSDTGPGRTRRPRSPEMRAAVGSTQWGPRPIPAKAAPVERALSLTTSEDGHQPAWPAVPPPPPPPGPRRVDPPPRGGSGQPLRPPATRRVKELVPPGPTPPRPQPPAQGQGKGPAPPGTNPPRAPSVTTAGPPRAGSCTTVDTSEPPAHRTPNQLSSAAANTPQEHPAKRRRVFSNRQEEAEWDEATKEWIRDTRRYFDRVDRVRI